MLELRQELADLRLGLVELGVLEQLLRSLICWRISSSREKFRASLSRDAFSGSRLRSASASRNMRSSSSVIWAATFSWVKPIVSRR